LLELNENRSIGDRLSKKRSVSRHLHELWKERLRVGCNKQKALAVRPGDCVVGCSTCRNLCRGNAISFPDLKELRKFYVKNRIWDRVKEELVAQGKIALPT